MTAALVQALSRLGPRERWLLAACVLVALPLGAVFGVIEPLSRARMAAATDLETALRRVAWTQARLDEARTLRARARDTAARDAAPPIGLSQIEEGLRDADLRDAASRLANREGDQIDLRLDAVPFDALTRWLDVSRPGWGYEIRRMTLHATSSPGLVDAELILGPAR